MSARGKTRGTNPSSSLSSESEAKALVDHHQTLTERRSSSIAINKKDDDNANESTSNWQSSLPLDWTRMKNGRKRRRSNDDDDDECVKDPTNCRCSRRHVRSNNGAASAILLPASASAPSSFQQQTTVLEGQAIFCLHDLDPQWVQGYFVPQRSSSNNSNDTISRNNNYNHKKQQQPWGLLAVQEEIDDCLACADGGYRQVSLTVYPPTATTTTTTSTDSSIAATDATATADAASSSQRQRSKPIRIAKNIDWTGGDMMTLYHPEHLEMAAEQLLTGDKAVPLLKKYFRGLLQRLKQQQELVVGGDDDDASAAANVLDWLPNVAVVKGSMRLVLPRDN